MEAILIKIYELLAEYGLRIIGAFCRTPAG